MPNWDPEANDLFLRAVEITEPENRGRFLDEACAGKPALRDRVDGLIRAGEQAGSFLEHPALDSGTASAHSLRATGEVAAARPGTGTVIGPYKFVQEIGEGGMGTVYLAQQMEPIRRLVAVKLVKPGMDSRMVLARFEAERQALALMDHPNIARVLDAGATPQGRPYFVMELVKGVPITGYCDDHRLEVRDRLALFVDVCRAVQHAHQKGVIHRDLKPSNVLVAPYDGKPVVKVIDFGVAKAAGQPLTDRTLVTELGAMVGTLQYMSPEQAELNNLDIDTRSDVYALGVLLYELLTGTTPLTRRRLKEGALLEVLRLIREEEPPHPSARLSTTEELPSIAAVRGIEPAKLSRLVRGELDWIVMKALEKDRDRRYETANGLAADLRRYLDDEPVTACPPSAWYRLRKLARRHKRPLSTAAIVFLTLIAGMAIATWQAVRARRAENLAQTRLLSETEALRHTESAREQADQERARAQDLARSLERELYVSRVSQAQSEWLSNNLGEARRLLDACPERLRAWEWYYARRLNHLEVRSLDGYRRPVACIAFNRDGTRIAAGVIHGLTEQIQPKQGELSVHDTAAGLAIFSHKNMVLNIFGVAFSPDGTRIATAGGDRGKPIAGELAVWDASTGEKRLGHTVKGTNVLAVAFSSDGSKILTGQGLVTYPDGDSLMEGTVWDARTLEPLAAMPGRPGGVMAVAFNPDGRRVALASSKVVEVWDWARRERLLSLEAHPTFIFGVAFSPDGRLLATVGHEPTVRLWNAQTGAAVINIQTDCLDIRGLAFSPDGTRLALAGSLLGVIVYDVRTMARLATFRGHESFVNAVAFAPDGVRLASASSDRTVKFWDTRLAQPPILSKAAHSAGWIWVTEAAVTLDNSRVVAARRDNTVQVWDVDTTEPARTLVGPKARGTWADVFWCIALRPDGREIAAGHGDGTVRRWDTATGAELPPLQGHTGIVLGVDYSPDGRWLASASIDGTVRIWDLTTGQPHRQLCPEGGGVARVRFSPDGRRLATGCGRLSWQASPGQLAMWDATSGQRLWVVPYGHRAVRCLAFRADGSQIAAAAAGGELGLYDASTGRPVRTWQPHADDTLGVAFTPDGRRLATCGWDSVKLWDASTWSEVFVFRGEGSSCVAFSPNGHRLIAGGFHGEVRLWDATPISGAPSSDKPPAEDRWQLANAHNSLGAFLSGHRRDYTGAITAFREAIRLKPD